MFVLKSLPQLVYLAFGNLEQFSDKILERGTLLIIAFVFVFRSLSH